MSVGAAGISYHRSVSARQRVQEVKIDIHIERLGRVDGAMWLKYFKNKKIVSFFQILSSICLIKDTEKNGFKALKKKYIY